MLLCCIILSSSGKSNASSRGSKKNFWRRCLGVCAKVNIPSTHHNPYLPHYIIFHLPLVFLSPQFTLAVLFALCLYHPSLSLFVSFPVCILFARVLDCLFVAMAQDNTKLCDFTNTNNNDFLSTPIAPLIDAESCEINTALLNLVMKDQFAGLPSEDAATHLNSFIDLCETIMRATYGLPTKDGNT